jgi:hypothetical protein
MDQVTGKHFWNVVILLLLSVCCTTWRPVHAGPELKTRIEVDATGNSTNATTFSGQAGATGGEARQQNGANRLLQGQVGRFGAASSASANTRNLQDNAESTGVPLRRGGPAGFFGCNTLSNHGSVSPYYCADPMYVQAIFPPSKLNVDGKPPGFFEYNRASYPVGTSVNFTFEHNGEVKHATIELIPFDAFQSYWMDWIKTQPAKFVTAHPSVVHQYNTTGAY